MSACFVCLFVSTCGWMDGWGLDGYVMGGGGAGYIAEGSWEGGRGGWI